jgi:hypothetical protein
MRSIILADEFRRAIRMNQLAHGNGPFSSLYTLWANNQSISACVKPARKRASWLKGGFKRGAACSFTKVG